jgi:hypothetical protein
MIDPLLQFDWSRLYENYDNLSVRFDPSTNFLRALSPVPRSDRALYYELRKRFRSEFESSGSISLPTYQAMLYWKLYSQPAALANTCKPLFENLSLREATAAQLSCLSSSRIDPIGQSILDQIQLLGDRQIWGMKSSTALPVRTTFLHFLSPTTNPIFDKQVLLAVGVKEKFANQKISFLGAYVDHAIELAKRHAGHLRNFLDETPLRLIDMALWVTRGSRP